MPDIEPIFLLIFIAGWVYLMFKLHYVFRKGDKMFESLAAKFPGYYEQLGKPKFFSLSVARNWHSKNFLWDLTFKGVPESFPKDKGSRSVALWLRKQYLRLLIVVAVMVVDLLIWGMLFHT